jgi:hypothetical protein
MRIALVGKEQPEHHDDGDEAQSELAARPASDGWCDVDEAVIPQAQQGPLTHRMNALL